MKALTLHVNRKYFEQIKSGEKKYEYRLKSAYWKKRLKNKEYDQVVIKLGYPKNHERDKTITFGWNSYDEVEITHPHFGESPVAVYAILLTERIQ